MISEAGLTFNLILVADVSTQRSHNAWISILITVSATKRNLEGSENYSSENPVPFSWPVSVEALSLSLLSISPLDN